MAVELATAYVSLAVEGSKVAPGVRQALGASEGEADRAGKRAGARFASGVGGATRRVGSLLVGAFAAVQGAKFLGDMIGEAQEAAVVTRRTANVIKSMGGVSKVSAGQVANLAEQLSVKNDIDDEAIQSGQNLLLTFGNIRNEVGKGNKVFDEASGLMVDMSVALGTSMPGAAKMLGRALNDPVKGMTALSRAGVTFTEGQKDQIKAWVESGDTLKAQNLIVDELTKKFGGAAEAMTTPADKARVAWVNLEEQLGTAVLPMVNRLSDWATNEGIPALSNFFEGMQSGKGAGGDFAAVMGDIRDVAKDAAPYIGRVVDAIRDMPDWSKTALAGGIVGVGALGKVAKGAGAARSVGGLVGLAKVQKVFETNPAALGGGIGGGKGGKVPPVAPVGKPTPKWLQWLALPALGAYKADGSQLQSGLRPMPKGMNADQFNSLPTADKWKIYNAEVEKARSGVESVFDAIKSAGSSIGSAMDTATGKTRDWNMVLGITGDEVDTLGGKKPKVPFLFPGLREGIKDTGTAGKRVDDVGRKKPKTPFLFPGLGDGIRRTGDLIGDLIRVDRTNPSSRVTVDASDALATIDRVRRALAGLASAAAGRVGEMLRFGGPKAAGGPVAARTTYLVGERGPELFTATHAGRIIPNHKLATTTGTSAPSSVTIIDADGVLLGTFRTVADSRIATHRRHDARMGAR